MSMFKRRLSSFTDFSTRLQDEVRLWNTTPQASRIDPVDGICAVCVDTFSRLFAVGTSRGDVRVYNEQFKETILAAPNGIKLLQFVRPRDFFKLLCIDSKNILHLWNLDVYGIPSLQASHSLDATVYRISTCLSHNHALLATQSGDVLTYDLAHLRLSPYKIPYALDMQGDTRASRPATDVVILPHKLNHVLVGYEGGAVLYDLVSQKVLKNYVQVSVSAILTTLALHPLGKQCAAGYEDGTICIWDLQSSKPLWVGTTGRKPKSWSDRPITREPIFKLEWLLTERQSDSSKSWLTVLGGLTSSDSSDGGISVLVFDTASLEAANTYSEPSGITHEAFLYPILLPAQDFAIVPVKTTSPKAPGRIIILSGPSDHMSVDAFEFPPQPDRPSTKPLAEEDQAVHLEFSAELEESEERSRNLAAALDDLTTYSSEGEQSWIGSITTRTRVSLPFPLLVAVVPVLAADMISVKTTEYLRLVGRLSEDSISGKDDRYRILITLHEDASIRFHDVSAFSDGVDLSLHPLPLEHLTIRVLEIPEVSLRPDIHMIRIVGVTMATEALECVVRLSTGEIVVLGLGIGHRTQDVLDDEFLDLTDARDLGDVFSPRFILRTQNGGANVVSLSDIGFLAVAFNYGLVMVIDMRGPNIILRDAQNATSKNGETNIAKCLYWAVSGLGEDSFLAPRLLALRQDGTLKTYSLARSDGTWAVNRNRTTSEPHHSLKDPIFSIVLDAQSGIDLRATPPSLAITMESTAEISSSKQKSGRPNCFWVAANRREIRVVLNITGEKVSKVNFSSQDTLDHIQFINAYSSSVLVGFTRGQAVIYSLPMLEVVHAFQLSVALTSPVLTPAGDLISRAGSTLMFASLLIHAGSSASGNVNFRVHKHVKHSSPETSSSHATNATPQTWASWIISLAAETTVTGDEIDLILAGPDVPEAPQALKTPMASSASGSDYIGKKSADTTTPVAHWGQDMYQQLTSAAAERGEKLGQLEEHLQSLQAGSKDLVAQAKKTAERQAARRWFL